MASDAPRPIDTKQPTMPVGGPQVQSIDLRGTVPGAGVLAARAYRTLLQIAVPTRCSLASAQVPATFSAK